MWQRWEAISNSPFCYNGHFVAQCILTILAAIRGFFRSRTDTALEVLSRHQQVAVLKRKRSRPTLRTLPALFPIADQVLATNTSL